LFSWRNFFIGSHSPPSGRLSGPSEAAGRRGGSEEEGAIGGERGAREVDGRGREAAWQGRGAGEEEGKGANPITRSRAGVLPGARFDSTDELSPHPPSHEAKYSLIFSSHFKFSYYVPK